MALANVNVLEPPASGFSVIHANRMENLCRVMVQWICRYPLNPLENEHIIVQSNGMAQWLKLALAANTACGISAAVSFQLAARFLWQVYRTVLGPERIPAESPYDKLHLHWRLMRLLPELDNRDGFTALARFLARDADLRKRYQLAGQLADLYDQYQVFRANWLEDWARGKNHLSDATGRLTALPESHVWQAELWRQLRADIPPEQRRVSRAEVHRRFLEAMAILGPTPAGLPRRVVVFGISSLPQQVLEALLALSACCQVLVFVHNPCRYYWADIIEGRDLLRTNRARQAPRDSAPAELTAALMHQHANPLLAAWGRQGRDYIGLLDACEQVRSPQRPATAIDLFTDVRLAGQTGTLLQQVQQAILDLEPLPATAELRPPVFATDQSILFQTAHSPQREVEILQDHLLACFARMPDLTPRDIVVMTPDIERYAPHIEAVFGRTESTDTRFIPFTIADRCGRSAGPLPGALEKLLHLPEARLTASDLIGLLDVPALRARFGLAQEDLPRLHQWIQGANIRWGLNAVHRRRFDLPPQQSHNTWCWGLQRMLLGYAVGAGGGIWQNIVPYDEIGGLEAATVGPLATLLETLENYSAILEQAAAPEQWCKRILNLLKDCFQVTTKADLLFRHHLEEIVSRWREACGDARLDTPLTLPVVRDTLLRELQAAGVSQRFLTGMVNFGTLLPMRAVPFRIVCLLGMNDGAYPRSHEPLNFDLMALAGNYRPGDRARREDDRYLFLEALLSSRDQFYISYIDRSVQDNSIRMPSVLVAQLRDYLAKGWQPADPLAGEENGVILLRQLTRRHPLQPFSRAYFEPLTQSNLFTYSHEWRAMLKTPAPAPAPAPGPLPPVSIEDALPLGKLIRFIKNPVMYFFNERLNVYLEQTDTADMDREPFGLDPLAALDLSRRLLEAGLEVELATGREAIQQAAATLRGRGDLPPGGPGELEAAKLIDTVYTMFSRHHELCRQWPLANAPVEVLWPLPIDGGNAATLEDWLDGLRRPAAGDGSPDGCARWEFEYKKLGTGRNKRYQTMLPLWVRHLAGCSRQLQLTSYLVAPDGMLWLTPLDPAAAGAILTGLMRLWWQGLQQPLPVAARTALAWLNGRGHDGNDAKAETAARAVYEGDDYTRGESRYNPYLGRAWPDFDGLFRADNYRFQTLAQQLYGPLLQAIQQ